MNLVVWLALFLVAGFFQFLILPLHLGLILVGWLELDSEDQSSVWLIFLAGLITDVLATSNLGSSSLFYLWFGFCLRKICARFCPTLTVLALLVVIAQLIWARLFFHTWAWGSSLILGGLAWLLYYFFPPRLMEVSGPEFSLG